MSRRVAACLWCLVLGCGRVEESERGANAEAGNSGVSGGAAVGGSASAGAGGVAGAAAGGVAGSVATSGACFSKAPICVSACDNNLVHADEACEAGGWRCPPGMLNIEECPADSLVACLGKELHLCTESCASEAVVEPVCQNRENSCANGTMRTDSCPVGSCANRVGIECCFANGTVKYPACKDGKLEACPTGSKQIVGQCYPTGVTANSCQELDGKECAADDYVCDRGCSVKCTCQASAAGRVWSCQEGNCFPD